MRSRRLWDFNIDKSLRQMRSTNNAFSKSSGLGGRWFGASGMRFFDSKLLKGANACGLFIMTSCGKVGLFQILPSGAVATVYGPNESCDLSFEEIDELRTEITSILGKINSKVLEEIEISSPAESGHFDSTVIARLTNGNLCEFQRSRMSLEDGSTEGGAVFYKNALIAFEIGQVA